jgi:hypothetical protein
VLVAGLLLGPASACTDAGLQNKDEEEIVQVDNLLDVEGSYCTSPAEEMEFPVKILIVMDQSTSLQCTDQAMLRQTALQRLVADVSNNPSVRLGYLGFHAGVFQVDFTPAANFFAAVGGNINSLGPATDYQGALSSVLRMLEQDMLNAAISMRARTKYVVMFISDGTPEPRCDAGCEDDDDRCSDGNDNDGDGMIDGADDDCADTLPDNLYGVCNTDEEIPDDVYVDMRSICPEYNKIPQLIRLVEDLITLGEAYGVGDISFHTTFLFAPQEVVDARCGGSGAQFGYVREEAQPVLQAMADAGRGVFQEVNTALETEGTFLRFNYQPLESEFDLTETLAVNQNTLPADAGRSPDTDGDGIPDDEEYENGTDRFLLDTDNDGYSDLFELRYQTSGFDGVNGNRPQLCCSAYGQEGTCCSGPGVCTCPTPPVASGETLDRDGDGLNAAEERFLNTDERSSDTDGDRLPDGLEFRLGLDPTVADALADHDFDGLRTRDEVRSASDPLVPDAEYEARRGVRYAITDKGEDSLSNRHCYDFDINGIELVTTLAAPGADGEEDPISRGINRTYLLMREEAVELAGHQGNLFIGCVEATYLGYQYKDPPDGNLDLGLMREACYRSCLNCDDFENLDDCRLRCLTSNNSDPGQCARCEEPCELFQPSELFDPLIHCVSSLCTSSQAWEEVDIEGTTYFMCNDNCQADGRCNCHCAYDCDCNPYRSERCATERVCR